MAAFRLEVVRVNSGYRPGCDRTHSDSRPTPSLHDLGNTPQKTLKLLFVSTSVGALGTGLGGGVELTLYNLARALQQRGHSIKVIAPENSHLPTLDILAVPGQLQDTAQTQGRNAPIVLPPHPVLATMWETARPLQSQFDCILNFAYDWLPFYLSPFFEVPVAHLVSMGSISEAMDAIVADTITRFPGSVAFHTRTQADTFGEITRNCPCLANGFEMSSYEFCQTPDTRLAWVGRIAPEKGLEDAIAAISRSGHALTVWGKMQFPDYWQEIRQRYPQARVEYGGFLSTEQLQRELGRTQGLLMTPKWVEAFGNVAVEALACGVPVIAYRRGGPSEIVRHGETGWLVEPDNVAELVAAIHRLPEIQRSACRRQAETEFSIPAIGDRVEAWLQAFLSPTSR